MTQLQLDTALNTLDLLKKGTTALAQRARAASRILEAQVGTNPRIRVQRDDAFVLWDDIPFQDQPSSPAVAAGGSPEWVRRTICCARWEVEHASPSSKSTSPAPAPDTPSADKETKQKTPKVVLAVLTAPAESGEAAGTTPVSASPVPLPAPQPNRFEPRSAGTLVAQWAARAGIEVFPVAPMSGPGAQGGDSHGHAHPHAHSHGYGNGSGNGAGMGYGGGGRRSPEDDRLPPRTGGGGGRGRRNSHKYDGRPPPGQGQGQQGQGQGLVERPPAVMAMMEMVSQPSRVVRVLARGEKLDPN